jgi:hypothetical protein
MNQVKEDSVVDESPVLNDRYKTYSGFPLLNADEMDPGYSGVIIHLLEGGLGDTLNSVPVIKGTKKAFPEGKLVVYCERRWLDIVRPYLSKKDELREWDVNTQTYESIFEDLRSSGIRGFIVPYMRRVPEQFAHGDSKQEALVKALHLSFFVPEIRPEIQISEKDRMSAEEVLQREGLVQNGFVILAPNQGRAPNKSWKKSSFEELSRLILKELDTKVVLLGQAGEVDLDVPGVIKISSLNIFEAGWVISRSCLFLGLDTGLSHLASVFNVPAVVLYPYSAQADMPFEVRVHSPFSFLIMPTPQIPDIVPVDVLKCIRTFKGPDKLQAPIFCPACGRGMWYVDQILSRGVFRRCVCGTVRYIPFSQDRIFPQGNNRQFSCQDKEEVFFLPERIDEMNDFLDGLKMKDVFSVSGYFTDDCVVHQQEIASTDNQRHLKDLFLSMDGLLFCLLSMGYVPQGIKTDNVSDKGKYLTIDFVSMRLSSEKKQLVFLWKGKKLTVPGWRWYFQYFSWEFWSNERSLRQFPKKIAQSQSCSAAFNVACILFRRKYSITLLKYMIKYFFKMMIKS